MSRWQEALALLEEAQEGFAACGAAKWLERSWACEGAAYFGLDRYDESRRLHSAGLDSAKASRDGELIAIYLGNIGQAFFAMGDLPAARRHLNEACDFFASRGCIRGRAGFLTTIGLIDLSERGADGVQAIEEASAVFEGMGMDAAWVDARVDLAEALVSVDLSIDVSDICREAYERAVALGIDRLAERALALLEPAVMRESQDPM